MNPIYAIGHSTRTLEQFIQLLQAHDISLLADIRAIPKSRTNPHFSRDSLEQELPKAEIKYRHWKELGGLRKPSKDSINAGWGDPNLRGFADYMQTEEFEKAIQDLIALAERERVAIMCAEGNPFSCHRALVADALLVRGVAVYHITSRTNAKEHQLSPFARVDGLRITYPGSRAPISTG